MSSLESPSGGRRLGPVVVDLRVLQLPGERAVPQVKLALALAHALERSQPGLVGRFLLAPDWPPPGDLGELLATGKVAYLEGPSSIHADARVYLSLFCSEIEGHAASSRPPTVEMEGLRFCAAVHSFGSGAVTLADSGAGGESAAGPGERAAGAAMRVADAGELGGGTDGLATAVERLRRAASLEALRHADAILATSEPTAAHLAAEGVDSSRITIFPPAEIERALESAGPAPAGRSWQADGTAERGHEPLWSDTSRVLEQLAARPRRAWHRAQRPRRLALVSPFPPVPSGVAEYSAKLVRALRTELRLRDPAGALDCFADGCDRLPDEPQVPAARLHDARSFAGIDGALAGYDETVFVLGNSQYHAGALAALCRNKGGGIVMAHEVRMTNLFRYAEGGPAVLGAGSLEEAIGRAYRRALPASLGRDNKLSAEDEELYGLLLLRGVARQASRLLVTSAAARRLAEVDLGPSLSDRLGVLPFSVALPDSELNVVKTAAAAREQTRFRIASFGIVDPIKQLDVLVGAAHEMTAAGLDVELFFVGPVSDSVSLRLSTLAADMGIAARIVITGALPRDQYLSHLGTADIAVQLRARDGGEASAAVGDCLAAGLPTVVSRLGWLGDLPDDVVVKLPRLAGPAQLADLLTRLLVDDQRRTRLADRAAVWAAQQTFEQTAKSLLDVMGVLAGSSRP